MSLDNATSIVNLVGWEFEQIVRIGKEQLGDRLDRSLQTEYFIVTRLKQEPTHIAEFEIGSKFRGNAALANLEPGSSLLVNLEGEYDIKRYRAKYAQRYSHAEGQFDIVVPETDMIYHVQHFGDKKPFVQWAVHKDDKRKQEIICNAGYALFFNGKYPALPLVALVQGNDILFMGESQIGATGYYKVLA